MIEIGTLCWFWDDDEKDKVIGRFDGERYGGYNRIWYATKESGFTYNYCRPVKIEEIKLGEKECVNA